MTSETPNTKTSNSTLETTQAKAALEALLDLTKGMAGGEAKLLIGHEFAESLLGILTIESVKASTGFVGKLILGAILKRFDTTSKRLTALEQRMDAHDTRVLQIALGKLESARDYVESSQDPMANHFRITLLNEARCGLEDYLHLVGEGPHTDDLRIAIATCAYQVPGGKLYGDRVSQPVINKWLAKATKLMEQARSLRLESAKYRESAKTLPERDTKTIPALRRYIPRAEDYIVIQEERKEVIYPRAAALGAAESAEGKAAAAERAAEIQEHVISLFRASSTQS